MLIAILRTVIYLLREGRGQREGWREGRGDRERKGEGGGEKRREREGRGRKGGREWQIYGQQGRREKEEVKRFLPICVHVTRDKATITE